MSKGLKSLIIGGIGMIVLIVGLIILSFYPYIFGNKQFFDVNQKYDYAIIDLPNGDIVEGDIKTWNDYEGEQIQITFEDGDTYLTSSFHCTLIDNK